MPDKIQIHKKWWVMLSLSILFAIGCHFTQQTVPTDATSSCDSTITAAEFKSWFELGTVSLDGAVKPANSLAPLTPNCSFYKWSAQMFLWLTSPSPTRYGGTGLIMNSPVFYDVSPPDASGDRTFIPHINGKFRAFNLRTAQKGVLDLPVLLEKKTLRLLEILKPAMSSAGRQLIMNAQGEEVEIGNIEMDEKSNQVKFFDTGGKMIERPRAILISKKDSSTFRIQKKLQIFGDNFDRSSLVQKFSIKDKVVFLDLAGSVIEVEQGQSDGGVLIAQNGSLVYYATTVNEVFAYFRTQQGATFSSPSTISFPTNQTALDNICTFARAHGKTQVIDSQALAIEIKSSWVEAAGLPDSNKFITITATVPTYDKSNPNMWVPNGQKTIKLAMVGMHVVGSTASHPELLWGSFEHVSNNPADTYSYTSTSGNKSIPINTTGAWVFCANGASAPFNDMHAQMSGDNIIPVSPFTIGPGNIIKSNPWGLPGSSAGGNAEVISINTSVRAFIDPNDIRGNYIQRGTTWTIPGTAPPSGQVGTNKLANTTLETFFQASNCFSCHQTNKTDVSHVFRDLKPLF